MGSGKADKNDKSLQDRKTKKKDKKKQQLSITTHELLEIGKSKKSERKKLRDIFSSNEGEKILANGGGTEPDGIHNVSSANCTTGLKSETARKRKKSKTGRKFQNSEGTDADIEFKLRNCEFKKSRKTKKDQASPEEGQKVPEKGADTESDDIFHVSSGDEDCTKGMKKWITEYHQQRPGLKILQQRIDDFITSHEAQLEQEQKEREAQGAEGGWTVVVHHKGRKKTTDSESGIVVGSVAQAAVEDKVGKKKHKEIGPDFYRFQRREAQRNEIMMLQSKFEEDRKRIQQLRAARKFRPY